MFDFPLVAVIIVAPTKTAFALATVYLAAALVNLTAAIVNKWRVASVGLDSGRRG